MAVHAPAQPGRAGAAAAQHHYLAWASGVIAAGVLLIGLVLIATSAGQPVAPEAPVEAPGAPVVNPYTGFTVEPARP